MKILAIHNFHRTGSASGDDQVFKSETALLESHGNKVVRYTVSNDDFDKLGKIKKIKATFAMLWSFKHYHAIQELIKREKPDIVHVHTFFPLLSPSILYAAKRLNVPVIVTLHDTRFICPCATSLRDAKLCNDCGDGHYFRMCKYGCFKGSKLQSFIIAIIFYYHRRRRTFYDQIDKYICLNDNQIRLLEDIGFAPQKIVKKYNFVPDTKVERASASTDIPKKYVVYYGRIGEEKGIRFLMNAWENLNIPLVVMGSGPLEDEFNSWADRHDNVYFLGYTQHDECLKIVKGSQFVVFPSIWYEGCSMVEIESESLGKALVATNLGFSVEAIQNGKNGFKFELGNKGDFVDKVQLLWNDPQKAEMMGNYARSDYENKFLPDKNYKQISNIYNTVKLAEKNSETLLRKE